MPPDAERRPNLRKTPQESEATIRPLTIGSNWAIWKIAQMGEGLGGGRLKPRTATCAPRTSDDTAVVLGRKREALADRGLGLPDRLQAQLPQGHAQDDLHLELGEA